MTTASSAELSLSREGAQRFSGVLALELDALIAALAVLPKDEAGVRISGVPALRPFLAPEGPIGAVAAKAIGGAARAVRAVLFNKTSNTNWSLAWHQDRTICVTRKIETPGFGPWTLKSGMQHVAPPFDLLTRMVTLRVHIDDVPASNAPLLIAPGSHKKGRVPVSRIEDVVRLSGTRTCIATAGDIWVYSTPILHASEAATKPAHRRVLQVDFAAEDLPGGLHWLGI